MWTPPALSPANYYPSLFDYLRFAGVEYEFTWIDLAVPAGTSVYATAAFSLSKYTLLDFTQFNMDQERGFYRLYAAWTGGVPGVVIPKRPIRLDSPIPADLVFQTLTGVVTPTPPAQIEIPLLGAAGQGNSPTVGSLGGGDTFQIIPPGVTVLVQFENASAGPSYWRFNARWFEVTPAFVPSIFEV